MLGMWKGKLYMTPYIYIEALMLSQIRMEYRNWTKICAAVLGASLHSCQKPQFVHPLFSNMSFVHTLFWILTHAKSLDFGSA
jgi:hypothetical protein